MSNSGVTTESGGRQNMFPSETRPYIDESVSYDGYLKMQKVNGRWAMVVLLHYLSLRNNRSNHPRNFLINYFLLLKY